MFKIHELQSSPRNTNLYYSEVTAGKLTVVANIRKATFDPSNLHALQYDSTPFKNVTRVPQTAYGHSDTVEDNFSRPVHCLAMYYGKGSHDSEIMA